MRKGDLGLEPQSKFALHCKLWPNHYRQWNGYYRQPIGTEQCPIQRYHRRPHTLSQNNMLAVMQPSAISLWLLFSVHLLVAGECSFVCSKNSFSMPFCQHRLTTQTYGLHYSTSMS